MKRKFKNLIYMFTMMTLVGCGGATSQVETEIGPTTMDEILNAEGTVENTLPITTDDVTLTIYTYINTSASQVYKDLSEHPVVKIMEEETGLNLEFIHPPQGDDGTFFNTTIASGILPDIIMSNFGSYPGGAEGAISDGVIKNPNALIAKYATNFNELVAEKGERIEKDLMSDSGTIINFGNVIECDYLYGRVHVGLYVRDDLLDKYGLDMPVTIADYEEAFDVMQANGIEHPLAIPTLVESTFKTNNMFASAFDIPSDGFYYNDDGEVLYSRIQPEYKEYLMLMNEWYNKGYISPDFVSTKKPDAQKTFKAGNAGFTIGGCWEAPTLNAVGSAAVDGFYTVGCPYPRMEDDDIVKYAEILRGVGTAGMFISSDCEHPVEAVKFIDYLYNIDTANLTEWGPGNEEYPTWELVDGKRVQTEFMTNNPDIDYATATGRYKSVNFTVRRTDEFQEQQYAPYPDKMESWENWAYNTVPEGKLPKFMTPSIEEARDLSRIMASISTYTDEMAMKFIVGNESFDNWDNYVAQVEALGIDEATKINSDAYARYLAR